MQIKNVEINLKNNGSFIVRYVKSGIPVTVKLRRGNLAEWQKHNPILINQELAFILDTKEFIIGDGVKCFNDLPRYKFVESKQK